MVGSSGRAVALPCVSLLQEASPHPQPSFSPGLLSTERVPHAEGLCIDFHIFFLEEPSKTFCGGNLLTVYILLICHLLAYRQWSLWRSIAFFSNQYSQILLIKNNLCLWCKRSLFLNYGNNAFNALKFLSIAVGNSGGNIEYNHYYHCLPKVTVRLKTFSSGLHAAPDGI